MSFAEVIGRQPLILVELDQDSCSLVYGVAPCTAALGVTGNRKCYNTFKTCQDQDNFDKTVLTLRFGMAMESTGLPLSARVIPSLKSVETVPTEINVGGLNEDVGTLGRRARITITINDHPYDDRLVDKYWVDRGFNPMVRGSFWSKWLARNPYYNGRPIRILEGYVGQTLDQMRVRHYIIDAIDGPHDGVVTITAKDPLVLLDNSRTQVPAPSNGRLDEDIDEDDTAILLVEAGVGAEYPASGIARIGSELVSYTRSGDNITLTGRALRSTVAETHSAGDTFQEVLVFDEIHINEALADLLINYAGIDPDFIPDADWAAEADLWLSGFIVSIWITEPRGISTLVAELVAQCLCFLWWDEVDQEIKFRAVRPYYPLVDQIPIPVTDDDNIVEDSVRIEARPDERISQIMIYWAPIDPTQAKDQVSNYARSRVVIAQDTEEPEQYGEKKIRTIFANWLNESNDATTIVVASRILERYRDTPRVFTFSADAKDFHIRVGRVITLYHDRIVDDEGAVLPTLLQITSSKEVSIGHRTEFSCREYLFRTRYGLIMPDDAPVYGDATDAEKLNGGFIAPTVIGFDNGDEPYRIL